MERIKQVVTEKLEFENRVKSKLMSVFPDHQNSTPVSNCKKFQSYAAQQVQSFWSNFGWRKSNLVTQIYEFEKPEKSVSIENSGFFGLSTV